MSLTAAEQKVRKLARLPSNCECANCGTTKKFGFSTVCIKYYTFVCNDCKSSHQAISHRCKSLTMSSWSDAEAAELQQKGNDYARRTWLQNAPPVGAGGRPKEGDPIDVFKRFVVDVYERKRYYGEDHGTTTTATMAASGPPASMPAVVTAIPLSRPPVGGIPAPRAPPQFQAPVRAPAPAPPPAPAPAPVADLLDFFSEPATTTSYVPSNGGSDTFTADFDAFAPKAPSTTAAPAPTPPLNDPFQPNFDSTTPSATSAVPSATSGFAFLSAETASSPNIAPAPIPAVKKPVMGNHTMSEKSNFISSMNASTSQNQQGFGTGMNMGGAFGGMPSVNMDMMQQQQQMMMMNNMGNVNSMNMMNNNNNMSGIVNGMNMMNMGGMNMNMMNNNYNNMTMGFGMMNGNNNNKPHMMMMNGGNINNTGKKNSSSMNSLDMNISSMNAWTTGNK
ncbi:putative GTPase activating protein [Nitzschia inconspicua]|uniref:GTPase activating protein n=1 Tax=Nitzschia inconspicua TaxID=303405 RepID=A0A9K3PTE0_9STRA|nr:putative GTPase activating protein [Nitzschia inconspicua]